MEKLQGFTESGGVSVIIAGTPGSVAQRFQQSFRAATITIYDAGTLSLSTIYSDDAATPTAKANPFTADATTGAWSFYAANGRYDVKFSGGGIAAPFTLGDYPLGVGNAGVPSYAFASLPTSKTQNAGNLARVTDTQGGLWMDSGVQWVKGLPMVNVRDAPFNAKGDGTTDDTAAFTAAIASLPVTGGIVLVPASSAAYIVTGITVTDKRIWLMGQGSGIVTAAGGSTIIKSTTDADILKFIVTYGNAQQHSKVSDLVLVGGGSLLTSQNGLVVDGLFGLDTENVAMFSIGAVGLFLKSSITSTHKDLFVISTGSDGIRIDESVATTTNAAVTTQTFIGGSVGGGPIGRDGFRFQSGGSGITVLGMNISGCTGYAINFASAATFSRYNRFINIWEEANTGSVNFGAFSSNNDVHFARSASTEPVYSSAVTFNYVSRNWIKTGISQISISGALSAGSGKSTVTTSAAHGLTSGNLVMISGNSDSAVVDGSPWPITVTTSTAFTIPIVSTGTSGTVTDLRAYGETALNQIVASRSTGSVAFRNRAGTDFAGGDAVFYASHFGEGAADPVASTGAFRVANGRGLESRLATNGANAPLIESSTDNYTKVGEGWTGTKLMSTPLLRGVVFASLPASPVVGMYETVTDSPTVTWGANITVGGSTNKVLAFYNGTNWTVAGK